VELGTDAGCCCTHSSLQDKRHQRRSAELESVFFCCCALQHYLSVDKEATATAFVRNKLVWTLGSSDFGIFLEIQYASCIFGLALKS
jgi:hypothetical protein